MSLYTTDATSATVPDLPDGWEMTTAVPNHLAFLHVDSDREDGHKRSVAVQPSGRSPGTSGWTAMGVAGYGPTCPRVERGESLEDAISAAVAEMAAVNRGEPAEDHGDAVNLDETGRGEAAGASSSSRIDAGEVVDEDGGGEDAGETQPTLDEWT